LKKLKKKYINLEKNYIKLKNVNKEKENDIDDITKKNNNINLKTIEN